MRTRKGSWEGTNHRRRSNDVGYFRSRGAQVALTIVALLTAGAALRAEQDKKEARQDQGLTNMQRSAAQYDLLSSETPPRPFEFREAAVMRISNPITGTRDGALYVWTNHGRPEAVLKFFTFDNKTY